MAQTVRKQSKMLKKTEISKNSRKWQKRSKTSKKPIMSKNCQKTVKNVEKQLKI